MSLNSFRNHAKDMLKRWGSEIQQGEGQPNVLAMLTQVGGGDAPIGPTAVGAMFSPEAERCDKLIHEIIALDRKTGEYLIAYSLGMSINDMARSFDKNRSTANIELERALAGFTMSVYYYSKRAA